MTARSNNTGERIDSALGIIRVPTTASEYGFAYDGSSIDAGTAMINASNANHLAYESVREIATDWREGNLSINLGETTIARAGGYFYPIDWGGPGADNIRPWNQISWVLDNGPTSLLVTPSGTARAYPLVLIFDAIPEDESGLVSRWIRCFIRAKSAATNSLQVACCVTPWGQTPLNRDSIWAPDNVEADLWKTVSTTEETVQFDLRPQVKLGSDLPRQTFRCEATGPNPMVVQVIAGVLWFGFYSTNTSDYWRTFSAYELREGT